MTPKVDIWIPEATNLMHMHPYACEQHNIYGHFFHLNIGNRVTEPYSLEET